MYFKKFFFTLSALSLSYLAIPSNSFAESSSSKVITVDSVSKINDSSNQSNTSIVLSSPIPDRVTKDVYESLPDKNFLVKVQVNSTGAVDPVLFWANKTISESKVAYVQAQQANDNAGMQAAAKSANDTRSWIQKSYPSLASGLLTSESDPLAYYNLSNESYSSYTAVAVNRYGRVTYPAESGYTYWEQIYKPTKFDEYQGKWAKALAGYGAGGAGGVVIKMVSKANVASLFGGGLIAYITDNYLPPGPDSSVTKTMIYRTNVKTGGIENLILDTKNSLIIDVDIGKCIIKFGTSRKPYLRAF